jgi:hypothetical protein
LSSERRYTLQVLPSGVLNGLRTAFIHRDPAGLRRAGAILAGFSATSAGYLLGRMLARFTLGRTRASQASQPSGNPLAEPPAGSFTPTRLLEVELSQPLPEITALDERNGQEYRRLSLLVRLHGQPIGQLTLALEAAILPQAELASRIWASLSGEINAHLQQDALP